jgi:hypothetical protein
MLIFHAMELRLLKNKIVVMLLIVNLNCGYMFSDVDYGKSCTKRRVLYYKTNYIEFMGV